MGNIHSSPLGKKSEYVSQYSNELLFPFSRVKQRTSLGIGESPPFQGYDIWNAYEFSWLNRQGKPQVAIAEFIIPVESPSICESKSLKLYLNSYNNTHFPNITTVCELLKKDIENAVEDKIMLNLFSLTNYPYQLTKMHGTSLDDLKIECNDAEINPDHLKIFQTKATEELYTDLFKTNCPITGQPDWASVQISYTGNKISHEGLLKYLISFRNHQGFHEFCAEKIFIDIQKKCAPENLIVYCRYTRRGGIDINPYRSSHPLVINNDRLIRQ